MNDLKSMKSLNEAVLKVMTNNVDLKDDIDEHYIQEDIRSAIKNQFDRFLVTNKNSSQLDPYAQKRAQDQKKAAIIFTVSSAFIIMKLINAIIKKDMFVISRILPGIVVGLITLVLESRKKAKQEAAAAEAAAASLRGIAKLAAMDPSRQKAKREAAEREAAERAAAEREAADPDTIFNSYDLESFNSGDSLQELNFRDIKNSVMNAASTINRLVRLIKPLYKLKFAMEKDNLDDIIFYGQLLVLELSPILDTIQASKDTSEINSYS